MKRNLFLLFAFATALASAQFNVETHGGDQIVDGQVIAFGTLNAELGYYVNNESTTDEIYMRIEFVSAVNYNGVDMQLCFGLCYDPIIEGQFYPQGGGVITIQPGENQNTDGDKFLNYNDGGGNLIDYNFRFFQVDGGGNEIGDDLSFTYRYDPNLSIADQNLVNAKIASTDVRDVLVVEALEATQLRIFDIQGRLVVSVQLNAGNNTVNVAHLPSQMYLVEMSNDRGANQVTKIVKR